MRILLRTGILYVIIFQFTKHYYNWSLRKRVWSYLQYSSDVWRKSRGSPGKCSHEPLGLQKMRSVSWLVQRQLFWQKDRPISYTKLLSCLFIISVLSPYFVCYTFHIFFFHIFDITASLFCPRSCPFSFRISSIWKF